MQKLMGLMRTCIEDYRMIAPGDRVAVGVSGGKDSLTLLVLLAALRDYYPAPFELGALSVDMGLGGMDFSPVADLCAQLGVPYTVKKTEIGPIIFEARKEKNPCSMCAKMRRGALHGLMQEQGFNKIALGHHFDDAVETFLMSLPQRRDADQADALHRREGRRAFCAGAAAAGRAQHLPGGQAHEAAGGQGADCVDAGAVSGAENARLRCDAAPAAAPVGHCGTGCVKNHSNTPPPRTVSPS